MAMRNIVKLGDPMLKKHSRTVEKFDDRLAQLIDDMKETMYANDGCGLAAVQVGILKRVVVLDVGCHVLDFVRYSVAYGAVFESFVNDLAVRSFDKAVLGYLCVCCEVGDKTDVRTFGSLDRAHSSVVRVVNVADFKGSSVT